MRSIPPALALAQRQSSVRPAIMITVGDVAFKTTGTGSTVTCHNTSANEITWTKDEGGRILKVKALESPYKQTAEITLNNYDRLLVKYSVGSNNSRGRLVLYFSCDVGEATDIL
jgi:uncharacterized protein YjhX (UPF0386 family)